MKPRHCLSCLLLVALGALGSARAQTAPGTAPRRVLFFTKSSNFEHQVIKEKNGHPSFAAQVLQAIGPPHGLEFTFSKDGSLFSPPYLAQFDVLMFYTSGDLLSVGQDHAPAMTPAGKAALLDAIRAGKGFVGVHAAGDTFHTGETSATDTHQPRTWRYRILGEKADPYTRMLGGELIVHGIQQIGTARVIDPKFPGFAALGADVTRQEEWYSMTDFAPDLHVLLVLDPATMRNPYPDAPNWPPAGWDTPYRRPPYPVTWAHRYGEGRVFYTALGHSEETWRDAVFQNLLLGGLAWASGQVDAPTPPNLAQVAPGRATLPPVSGSVAGLPKGPRELESQTPLHTYP